MTLLWKYNPFMFSISDHAPVPYKGTALPINVVSLLLLSSVLVTLHQYKCLSGDGR